MILMRGKLLQLILVTLRKIKKILMRLKRRFLIRDLTLKTIRIHFMSTMT